MYYWNHNSGFCLNYFNKIKEYFPFYESKSWFFIFIIDEDGHQNIVIEEGRKYKLELSRFLFRKVYMLFE